MNKTETRKGDNSQNEHLIISQMWDGDIIITVVDKNGKKAQIEFCETFHGGGRSRNTHRALINLLKAMKNDNRLNPL